MCILHLSRVFRSDYTFIIQTMKIIFAFASLLFLTSYTHGTKSEGCVKHLPECYDDLLDSSEYVGSRTMQSENSDKNYEPHQKTVSQFISRYGYEVGTKIVPKRNRNKVIVQDENFEDGIGITIKVEKQLCVVSLYRPPNNRNVAAFMNSLNNTLTKLKVFSSIVIVGDTNIDIEKRQDQASEEYLQLLTRHQILPACTLPTRDKVCLNYCIVREKNNDINQDPKALMTKYSPEGTRISVTQMMTKKSIKKMKVNYDAVQKALSKIVWQSILDYSDIEKATEAFMLLITSKIEQFSSTKIMSIPKRNIHYTPLTQPSITPELIKCMRRRMILRVKTEKEPNNIGLRAKYGHFRDLCNKILKNLGKTFNATELLENAKDCKVSWDRVHKICNKPKERKPAKSLLHIMESPSKSLNYVNDYYINVGSRLAKDILLALNDTEHNLARKQIDESNQLTSFEISTPNSSEIYDVVINLKNVSAVGWDKTDATLMKTILPNILEPLTAICQVSFDTGIFPKVLKKSILFPKYKSGDINSIKSYRPISNLPILSKILEKVMNTRLKSFLENNMLLSNNQFGYRPGRSTEAALKSVSEYIKTTLDNRKKLVAIFLDLEKAFDTVSLPILLAKIEAAGIRGTPLKWFQSYLTGRKQTVEIGGFISREVDILYGVPQGSSIGPLLFLIYINQLCDMELRQGKIVTFADDSMLLFHGDTWTEVQNVANEGLEKVSKWLRLNLLSVNILKTKYKLFTVDDDKLPKNPLQLKMHKFNCKKEDSCRCNLNQTEELKYLGTILDNKFIYRTHSTPK